MFGGLRYKSECYIRKVIGKFQKTYRHIFNCGLLPLNERPILVTGIHRSGTKFVGRVLSMAPNIEYWHEPVCPFAGLQKERLPYLRKNTRNQFFEEFFSSLMRGDFVGTLPDQRKLFFLINPYTRGRILVKDPSAAFMIEWLEENFNFVPIILIRHPCAFVSSIMKLNWNFSFYKNFLKSEELMVDFLEPFRADMERFDNLPLTVDKAAFMWGCIYKVLTEIGKNNPQWNWYYYERIAWDPVKEFCDIYEILALEWSSKIEHYVNVITNNDSNDPHGTKKKSKDMIFIWQQRLSKNDINKILSVIERFEIPLYKREDFPESELSPLVLV